MGYNGAMEPSQATKNPLDGRWTFLSMAAAVIAGMASLLLFLAPSDIVEAFQATGVSGLRVSIAFFFIGCWLTVERWRANLNFRVGRTECAHSMGVAHAGNLLIPGRVGEPLRVFALARLGVCPEVGTSALVQERLLDQVLRVVFVGLSLLIVGASFGGDLAQKLLLTASLAVIGLAGSVLLVRSRVSVSQRVGVWAGFIPRVRTETVSRYLLSTLDDLADNWSSSGSRKAVLWAFLAWLVFSVHYLAVLKLFFPERTLAMCFLMMAFSPVTAPTQPGVYHAMIAGALMMLGADKVPAIQVSVVLHMIQMVGFALWGGLSWVLLHRRAIESVPAQA